MASGSGMMPAKQPNQPDFVFKFFQMLQGNENLITYCEGRVQIKNPSLLANEVLPRYFRTSRFSSFQRQLNNFGFRKIEGKGKLQPCTYFRDDLEGLPPSALLNIGRATKPLVPPQGTQTQSRSLRAAAQQAGRSGQGGGTRRAGESEENPYRTEYRNASKRRRLADRSEDQGQAGHGGQAGPESRFEHGLADDGMAQGRSRGQRRNEGQGEGYGPGQQQGQYERQGPGQYERQAHRQYDDHGQRQESHNPHRYMGNGAGEHDQDFGDCVGHGGAGQAGDFYLLLNNVSGDEPVPPQQPQPQQHYQERPHGKHAPYQGQQRREAHHSQHKQYQQQPSPHQQSHQQYKQQRNPSPMFRSSPTYPVGDPSENDNASTNDLLEVLTLLDSGVQVGELSTQQQARLESSMTASIFGKRHKMKPDAPANLLPSQQGPPMATTDGPGSGHRQLRQNEQGHGHSTGDSDLLLSEGSQLSMYEAPQSVTGGNSYDCVASLEAVPPNSKPSRGYDQDQPRASSSQGQYPTRSPGHYPRSMTANPPPGGGRAVYVAPLTMREAGMGASGKLAASIFGKRHTFQSAEESATYT